MSRSPAAIDADLSRATAELAELIRQRGELSARIEAAEARVRALTAEGQGLLAAASDRTIRSMNVDTRGKSAAVKRGAGRSTRKHPAQKKLYERGMTISSLAAELGETRARVSSWFAGADANRPIPRHHAVALRERYGIALGDWSRIAD